jgi:L-alanine-DL-glutamate epimerase-like enolase superfamily enzyme
MLRGVMIFVTGRLTAVRWRGYRLRVRPLLGPEDRRLEVLGYLLFCRWEEDWSVGDASLPGWGHSASWQQLGGQLRGFLPGLLGRRFHLPLLAQDAALGTLPGPLRFALETAIIHSRGFHRLAEMVLPYARATERLHAPPEPIPLNALLLGRTTKRIRQQTRWFLRRGVRVFKLKVGRLPLEEDLARVRAVREEAGPEAEIRLDANGAWSEDSAARALDAFAPLRIAYVEQPLPPGDLRVMARLREASPIPLALDEGLGPPETWWELDEYHPADVIVLKPSRVGLLAAEYFIEYYGIGRRIVLTTGLESGVGTVATAHLAARFPELCEPAGLATPFLLENDLLPGGTLELRDGCLHVALSPFRGIPINPDALSAHAAGPGGSLEL